MGFVLSLDQALLEHLEGVDLLVLDLPNQEDLAV